MYFLDINLSSDLNKKNFPDRQTFIRLNHVYGIQEIHVTCTTAKTVSLNFQFTVFRDNVQSK